VVIALIGILLLVIDLAKKQNYVPNLIVTLLLVFQSAIWELRYTKVWLAIGEPFANLFF
jgi:membrane-bound ClpP family serine protease